MSGIDRATAQWYVDTALADGSVQRSLVAADISSRTKLFDDATAAASRGIAEVLDGVDRGEIDRRALVAALGYGGAPFGRVHDLVGDLGHRAAPKNWGPKDWGVRKPS